MYSWLKQQNVPNRSSWVSHFHHLITDFWSLHRAEFVFQPFSKCGNSRSPRCLQVKGWSVVDLVCYVVHKNLVNRDHKRTQRITRETLHGGLVIRGDLGATSFACSLRCHQGYQTLLSLREISSLGFRTVDDLFHGLLRDSVLGCDLRYFQQLFHHLREMCMGV